MARDLFIDLTNRRLVASETNSAPVGLATFTKGDNGAFNLYFLEATGVINRPFEVVDKSSTSVKLGIGSRLGVPETGTYTLTFGGDTTSALDAAATAGAIQTALNALSAISSAGGVTVTGELADHFTARFNNAGSRASISADVSQLIPDTAAVIDERIAGSATAKEVQEIQLRLTPAVYQDAWTNLGTTVTATIATTVTGSASNNEVQRLSFSRQPFTGTYRISVPGIGPDAYGAAITNGVIELPIGAHALSLNQPISISFSGTITGLNNGQIYFVRSIPSPNQFAVAATAGGVTITSSAITDLTLATIARQTAPISANASAADIQAALQSLDSIGAGNVIVTGIVGEFFDIVFSGNKGYAANNEAAGGSGFLPVLTVQNGTTAKPGKTADVNFSTFALRDLLGNNPSVDLDLELELTESGTRSTVILQPCSVAEELIDANAFSPTSGYPSFIFQALTAAATNATTSLVAITALNWTAQANSEYLAEWGIIAQAGSTGSIDGKISLPTGSDIYGNWFAGTFESALWPTDGNLDSRYAFYVSSDSESYFIQKGYISTGATAGTVSFSFAENTGTTGITPTIKLGSWVRVEKVK